VVVDHHLMELMVVEHVDMVEQHLEDIVKQHLVDIVKQHLVDSLVLLKTKGL